MPIVIPSGGSGSSSGSGVTTYAGLVTSVQNWLNRPDLDAMVPDFIDLLEAELNRELRVPDMEDTVDLDAEAIVDLPTDFLELRSLTVDTTPRTELIQAPLAQIEVFYESDTTGRPAYFSISDGAIKLGPEPVEGYTLRLAYYKVIPALSPDDQTNWLIVSHPDVYLWGTLALAEAFIWDDPRVPMWRSAFDSALDSLKRHGRRKRHGGALSTRTPNVP
jgi:hypothetical protein